MNPRNARLTVLNSDFPLDKQLAVFTGSFVALARFSAFQPRRTELSMPHNVGGMALINGVYSFDGVNWLQFGVVNANITGSTPTFQTVEVNGYCTDTDLVLLGSSYLAANQTIYYAVQLLSRE